MSTSTDALPRATLRVSQNWKTIFYYSFERIQIQNPCSHRSERHEAAAAAAAGARGRRRRSWWCGFGSRGSGAGTRRSPRGGAPAPPPPPPRDGKHLEVLGYYNPLPGKDGGKRMGLKFDRVKYWLSVGAQPSDPVQRILFRAGLLPPPPMLAMARKGGARDRRPIHPMTGRPLDLEGVTVVDDSSVPEDDAEQPVSEE
uniref:30S ribosomal protein S16 n=1 Tax=Oryza brachyantha TaxID=4533 RepID=J3MYU4_ORYBR